MHSSDKTLLARLGFQDPDHKFPDHDDACKYLSRWQVLGKILGVPEDGSLPVQERPLAWRKRLAVKAGCPEDPVFLVPCQEHPIVKGAGQYRTHVGFLDLVVPVVRLHEKEGDFKSSLAVLTFEVKVNPVPIGDLLRQMNLYRSYSDVIASGLWAYGSPTASYLQWFVATRYPLSDSDALLLKRAGYRHVLLGSGFDAWQQEQASVQAARGASLGADTLEV